MAHFAACRAMRPMLAGWDAIHQPQVPMLVALCRCFVAAIPALPPTALDTLAGQDTLGLLYIALVGGREAGEKKVVAAVMEVLARIVVHATDGIDAAKLKGVALRRGVVQARVREMRFLDEALSAMVSFKNEKTVLLSCLRFLRAAVEDNVQNIVELGALRETHGLQLILRCTGDRPMHHAMLSFDSSAFSARDIKEGGMDETTEMLCTVCDLVVECSKVRKNFETCLSLDLTIKLIELLGRITSSGSHVKKALELLSRSVRSSVEEGRKAFTELGAAAVVSCMQVYRHNPRIQEAAIITLISMVEVFEKNRESACEVHAIQAVHFALIEHSKDAKVVAVACKLLLQFAPYHLMSSNLQIQELKKLLRARFKTHKENPETAMMIDDLATALDLISQQSIRAIDDFLNGGLSDRSGAFHSGSLSCRRLRSSKGPLSASFRMSAHRRGRHNRGLAGEAYRRRRARSDFDAETTLQRRRKDSYEIGRSLKSRSSRLRDTSWLDSRNRWPSDISEVNNALQPRPEDDVAYDPLIETLGRYRETQPDPVSYSSVPSLGRQREPVSVDLPLSANGGNTRPLVVEREMRESRSAADVRRLGGLPGKSTAQHELQTLIEKRMGPVVRSRRRASNGHVDDMSFEAMDSNSGRSDLDMGEEDSLFSFSDSEKESADDDVWDTDEGKEESSPPDEVGSNHTNGCQDEDDLESSDIEGDTISPLTKDVVSVGRRAGVMSLAGNLALEMRNSFETDDGQFGDVEEANTDSLNSQNNVSILTDSISNSNTPTSDKGSELVPQSQRYGERERVRSENARNSGNWGPPKESIWPLISIDNAADVHRSSPIPRPHTRGESGSLTSRR